MTWLLNSAAAIDARRRAGPCWHDMAAELMVTAAIDARCRTGLCWHDMAAELLVTAAIDARHQGTDPCWHDMASCFHHRCDMVIRINRRKRVVFTHKCIYLQHEYG